MKGAVKKVPEWQKIKVLPPSRLAANKCPVAVPDKIFGLTLILNFIDRCHSLCSLDLPLAAVASLPTGLLHLDGFESLPARRAK